MKKEIRNTWNGERIILIIDKDGHCLCPVCGEKSNNIEWRPYDKTGLPSYDICSCGFEYGCDDGGIPPHKKSWECYRMDWLEGNIDSCFNKKTKEQKMQQLKNLDIKL